MKLYVFVAVEETTIIVRPYLDRAKAESQRNGDRTEDVRVFEIDDATIRSRLRPVGPQKRPSDPVSGDYSDILESLFGKGGKR